MAHVGKAAALSVIPIIVISVLLGVYLSSTLASSSSQSLAQFVTNSETTNSTLGLELALWIKSPVLQFGNGFELTISIQNVLVTTNNLTRVSNWAYPVLQNLSFNFFSCPWIESFVLLNGYYTASNISSVSESAANILPLSPNFATSCPNNSFNRYVFQPSSTQMRAYGASSNSFNMNLTEPVSGYYENRTEIVANQSLVPSYGPNATLFRIGTYTIAAGDEWGQSVILHFLVTSPSLTTPFNYPMYLSSSGASSTWFFNGTTYSLPGFYSDINEAYVFNINNCASPASSSSGCIEQIVSTLNPQNRYNMTVWYPYVNQNSSEPSWANCMYYVKGTSGTSYAYCISLNSTAFIVSEPGPPPA